MIVYPPDLHPGRCRNYRQDNHLQAVRRCLEYENETHVCRFDPPGVQWNPAVLTHSTTTLPQPKPWIRPDNTNLNPAPPLVGEVTP